MNPAEITQVPVVSLCLLAGMEANGPSALDGSRLLILQFKYASDGEELEPVGMTIPETRQLHEILGKFLAAEAVIQKGTQ